MKAFAWDCLLILFIAGCAAAPPAESEPAQEEIQGVYRVLKAAVQPRLATYCGLTVLVDGEVSCWSGEEIEKAFKAEYQQAFPEQKAQFVERADTEKVLAQAREKEIPPVDAIVRLLSSYEAIVRDSAMNIDTLPTLNVRIVDCKTGEPVAHVVVACDSEKAAATAACRKAVTALKSELEKVK